MIPEGDNFLLSFIIPTWNRAKTIVYCLDSILSQSLVFPFEIIVVDDASTDETCLIIEEIIGEEKRTRLCDSMYARTMLKTISLFSKIGQEREFQIRSRIKLLRLKTNKGAAIARNSGMEKANGDYIWFVDSDDFIASDALRILKPMLALHNYDVLRFSIKKCSSVPDSFVIENEASGYIDMNCDNEDDLLFLLNSGTVWSRVFRRDFIKQYHFNPSYAYSEDSQFVWQATLNASKLVYIKDTLYGYMDNPESLTSIKPYNRFVCYIKVVEEYLSLVRSTSKKTSCKDALVLECEKRLYTHAFFTYKRDEITKEMWGQWYGVYYKVMVKNKMRKTRKRLLSWLIWCIHINVFFIIIYKFKHIGGKV